MFSMEQIIYFQKKTGQKYVVICSIKSQSDPKTPKILNGMSLKDKYVN